MSHALRSQLLRTVFVLVACAIFTVGAFAQSTVDGAIAGTVTDQTKAVVPGAKVTIRNIDTNATSTATTDDQGKFRVTKLQPGTYAVTIEAANFAVRNEKAVVEVGTVTTLESTLGVAGTQENVEITADAPAINTIQQDFATNINQTQINDLPINGRRWSNFALLAPGATPDGAYGLISFRGISGLLNNSTVDGGDNNQAFFSEERGRTRVSYVISQASVREFQVNTSNYSAEYGRAAGGVVNSVTKSGTNNLHGSAFYYLRDNKLGAGNAFWFQPVKKSDGTYTKEPIKPTDRRQQFGGTLGGALVKDRLFYFLSYDQQKRNYPSLGSPNFPETVFAAPTSSQQTSLARAMYNLSSSTTPTADQMTGALAAWNRGLDFIQAETGIVKRNGDQHITFPKIDWRVSDRHNFSLGWNRMRWFAPAGVQSQPVVARGVASFGDDGVKVDIVNARLTSTLTNTLLNELRLQWGRDFEFQSAQPNSAAEAELLEHATTFGPGGNMPAVFLSSVSFGFGKPNFLNRVQYPDEKRIQVADTMTWATGKHLVKYGFDVNQVVDRMNNLYREGGDYSYSNVANFITDYVTNTDTDTTNNKRSYSNFNQGFGSANVKFATYDLNFFLQDDYRILPRLTLNLGLRYEYQMMPKAQYSYQAAANADAIAKMVALRTGSLPSDENNWGPRFGFAWDVMGTGKTAVRGGYGIYYGRMPNSTISNAITNTGAATGQWQVQYTTSNGPFLPNAMANGTAGSTRPDVVFYAENFQAPQIHQGDLIIEHEIAKNTVVKATYLLSMGRHLVNFMDLNLKPASLTTDVEFVGGLLDGQRYKVPYYTERVSSAVGRATQITSNVNSNYNALVLEFNRRMTGGLQFSTNYTWSKSLDYGQDSQTFTSGNAMYDAASPWLEYGTSNFDIRHKFVTNVIWQPQFFADNTGFVKHVFDGWSIAPIVSIMSGKPYTERTTGNVTVITGYNPTTGAPILASRAVSGVNGSGGINRLAYMMGRNSFRFPRTEVVDLRLSRRFKVREGHSIEFLAEAFNLFNTLNVTDLGRDMYNFSADTRTGATANSPYVFNALSTFGVASEAGNTNFRERQIQFALRYEF